MNSRWTFTLVAIIRMAVCAFLLAGPRAAKTQQRPQSAQKSQPTPSIEEYQPKSTLVTKEHKIERAKFPFIDIQSHHWNPTPQEVNQIGRAHV